LILIQNYNISNFPVGNKIDEPAELREVTHAEGQAQAAEWSVQFMETSAKTNHNVTELFQVMIEMHLISCPKL
jgi:DIRAS family GTP-binding Ras-like protein 2